MAARAIGTDGAERRLIGNPDPYLLSLLQPGQKPLAAAGLILSDDVPYPTREARRGQAGQNRTSPHWPHIHAPVAQVRGP